MTTTTTVQPPPAPSTCIESFTYAADTETLVIRFCSLDSGNYQYSNVPAEVMSSMGSATMRGAWYHANIRGKFSCKYCSSPFVQHISPAVN